MKPFIIAVIILYSSICYASPSPNEGEQELIEYQKTVLRFDEWPGKDTPLIKNVNLLNENIPSLHYANVLVGDGTYRMIKEVYNNNPDHEYIIQFRYFWSVKEDNDVRVTMYVANTALNAQEYLLYLIAGHPDPSVPKLDDTPVAGLISLNDGRFFVRNNVLVTIGTQGVMNDKKMEIARDIDTILILQPVFESFVQVFPRFSNVSFDALTDRKAMITPHAIDPLGGEVTIEYRLDGGMIYQKNSDTIYYIPGDPGQYTIQFIAIAESGFHATQTVRMTATEDDIFN